MPKAIKFRTSEKGTEDVTRKFKKLEGGLGRMRVNTSGLQRVLGVLRNKILLVTFATAGMVAIIKKTTDLYRTQVEAMVRLTAGLKNVEGATEGSAQKLFEYASALQKATTFGDEFIISAMAQLATFQMNETQIATLTPRILDMAAAMGIKGEGLTSLAIMAGKAFTGQAGALTRYGVVLDKAELKLAKTGGVMAEFNFLLKEMDKNYRGAAAALRDTLLGQIDSMEMEIGDLNEQLGANLLPVLKIWTKLKLELSKGIRMVILAMSKEYTIGEAIIKVNEDSLKVEKELLDLRINAAKKIELSQVQALARLQKQHEFLSDDKVITQQEQIMLLEQERAFVQQQYNEGMITKIELGIKDLELHNRILMIQGQMPNQLDGMISLSKKFTDNLGQAVIYGQDLGDAVVSSLKAIAAQMISQAALYMILNMISGGGFGAISGAAGSKIAGGFGKFLFSGFQKGGSFTIPGGGSDNQLVMFRGSPGERVTIENPMQQTTINRGITINVMSGADVGYVREYLKPELERLDSLGD